MNTKYNPAIHHRRSIRLKDYDYAQAGAYFVTICAHQKECVFGAVVNDEVRLNAWGEIIALSWNNLPRSFPNVELDTFVVMPNHVHGVILISRGEAAANGLRVIRRNTLAAASPLRSTAHGTLKGSLGAIMQTFKSLSTRRINAVRHTPGITIWQRNYYERVIRSEKELNSIRRYIADNPLKWALDAENPTRK